MQENRSHRELKAAGSDATVPADAADSFHNTWTQHVETVGCFATWPADELLAIRDVGRGQHIDAILAQPEAFGPPPMTEQMTYSEKIQQGGYVKMRLQQRRAGLFWQPPPMTKTTSAAAI